MPTSPSKPQTTLAEPDRLRVLKAAKQLGLANVARELRVSPKTAAAAAAGIDQHPGTIAIVLQNIGRLPELADASE